MLVVGVVTLVERPERICKAFEIIGCAVGLLPGDKFLDRGIARQIGEKIHRITVGGVAERTVLDLFVDIAGGHVDIPPFGYVGSGMEVEGMAFEIVHTLQHVIGDDVGVAQTECASVEHFVDRK